MTTATSDQGSAPAQATDAAPVDDHVILLAEDGSRIGHTPRATVHGLDTPLHLAFSCYLLREDGQVLLTRRALAKRTWPGVWTNSFCGHPAPGESMEDAITRRAARELGITVSKVQLALPDFRYRAVDASGIVENEICPVYTAVSSDLVTPSADEVAEWKWVEPGSLRDAVAAAPWAFSPWLGWQLETWPVSATR